MYRKEHNIYRIWYYPNPLGVSDISHTDKGGPLYYFLEIFNRVICPKEQKLIVTFRVQCLHCHLFRFDLQLIISIPTTLHFNLSFSWRQTENQGLYSINDRINGCSVLVFMLRDIYVVFLLFIGEDKGFVLEFSILFSDYRCKPSFQHNDENIIFYLLCWRSLLTV